MNRQDFLTAFSHTQQPAWEDAAVHAMSSGDAVDFPWIEVPLSVPTSGPAVGHTGSVFVSSDVFSIGSPSSFIRLPMSPIGAQRAANVKGYFLPTRKIANDIFKAATVKLKPQPAPAFGQVNKGPNLPQYDDHDKIVTGQIEAGGIQPGDVSRLVTGHKKDVVISNAWKPGHVVIYGWFNPDGSRIQPLFAGHDDHYADYSHGIRFVRADMTLDGQSAKLEDVLKGALSGLVSDEGPIKTVRYPTPGYPPPLPGGSGGGGVIASMEATNYRGFTALVDIATRQKEGTWR